MDQNLRNLTMYLKVLTYLVVSDQRFLKSDTVYFYSGFSEKLLVSNINYALPFLRSIELGDVYRKQKARPIFACFITPKQRWIRLYSSYHS